jgi:hypothetical protein
MVEQLRLDVPALSGLNDANVGVYQRGSDVGPMQDSHPVPGLGVPWA